MHLFRVFGRGGVAKTREQRTKLRKRGLKRGKGEMRRAKVRGKRGKIWGRVRWGNYPAWKWKKNGKSVKYAPYDKKEAFTPAKSAGTLFYSILEKSIFWAGRFFKVSRHLSLRREVEYMNSCSYVIFLTYCWCILSLSIDRTEGGDGVRRAGQRAGQVGKISKNRGAARRKKSFLCAFSDFF